MIDHPIVGIGASAGGVEALQALFRGVPADRGLSFIVVLHLPATRQSILPEIIGRCTALPSVIAADGMTIEPDHVYCAPPDSTVVVKDRRISLLPRGSGAPYKPIDLLLSSLAKDVGATAIGVLLSGSGSDGALGMKAIKEAGGLTLAQGADGSRPEYSEMPRSAIASGAVDLVLSVEDIGARLATYAATFAAMDQAEPAEQDASSHQAICEILLDRVGHDFSGYKHGTFHRRVRRRMQVLQIESVAEYVERLRSERREVDLLFRDLLIGVTTFFRDPHAFEFLEKEVVPKLFERDAGDGVRIWVPGCSTGEEVYSVAILAREYMQNLCSAPKVQIFATDIDETALSVARAGVYPEALTHPIGSERLRAFFTASKGAFVVKKELREICVFSAHNVLRDPPFSRMDLISCRNLLIYLGSEFQAHVMPIFHFALRPRRYLFLGTSENVAASTDLFAPVDKKRRVFQRRDHVRSLLKLPSFSRGKTNLSTHPFEESPSAAGSVLNLRRAVDARIIERFAPAHVVVDGEGTVLHYSPRTGRYLEAAAGRPDRQLLAMARKGLRLDLRAALQETTKSQSRAERRGIPLDVEDRVHVVDLVVEPLVDTGSEPLFLVVFKDMPAPGPVTGEQPASATDNDANLERLERELHDVRERLQATVEEYDAALEELTSANEELQSTNEELETSREEMQSLNEELQTSNAELLRKVDEVHSAHDDLRNLINSTRIAVVFLDRDLVIRAFTPAATDIFNLISTDRGRPLTDIASNVTMTDLRRDIRTVYERDEPMERNVQGADGNVHYLMRLLPYRAENKRVEGVLVTFVDITGLVRAEARQRSLVEELNHRVRNMLMTVNVVAKQTLKRTPDPRAFAEAFTERIRAMADAYGLVVAKEQWRDVPLRDILATQLRPYEVAARDRVRLSGPEVLIAPNVAISLGMIAHELATNAAKYGALSAPAGRVSVDWGMKGGGDTHALLISWREEGGPAAHEPDRRGFGSELMEAEVRQKLHGSIDLEYRVEGFSADILIPTGNGVWE